MKLFTLCFILLSGIIGVRGGGYILKGGVVDFQRPLDYMDSAIYAGKMAWSQKSREDEVVFGHNSDRNTRNVAYVPTFYTSYPNGVQPKRNRKGFLPKFRSPRPQAPFSQPLFYSNYNRQPSQFYY